MQSHLLSSDFLSFFVTQETKAGLKKTKWVLFLVLARAQENQVYSWK